MRPLTTEYRRALRRRTGHIPEANRKHSGTGQNTFCRPTDLHKVSSRSRRQEGTKSAILLSQKALPEGHLKGFRCHFIRKFRHFLLSLLITQQLKMIDYEYFEQSLLDPYSDRCTRRRLPCRQGDHLDFERDPQDGSLGGTCRTRHRHLVFCLAKRQ